MKAMLPTAVESKPWMALSIILGVCFGSAVNITFAEWRDCLDSSATTTWQPELVLDAWVDGLRTFALAIYAYLTRSGTADRTQELPKPEP